MVPEEWLAAVVQRNFITHSYPRERPPWVYAWPHLKKTIIEPLGQAMQQLLINDLRDRPPMGRPAAADVSTTFANKQGFYINTN